MGCQHMSLIAIITLLLKYGPTIWTLVSEIWELINKLEAQSPAKAALYRACLKKAMKTYRETSDRRPLRAMRDGLHLECFGDECPKD